MNTFLGIDCGSVSLNLVLVGKETEPVSVYLRTRGRPLRTFVQGLEQLMSDCGGDVALSSALVTGSARDYLSEALGIPAVNEITAHATGTHRINPEVRTIIEIGGQDSKFIKIEPVNGRITPRITAFRMNEICAAGTGAFLDEQAQRLGISVESFGAIALRSGKPAPIAGRCAVFAKTDMIHQAQDGTPLPDILLGLAFALARNYIATLVKGDSLEPLISLQGGVMSNQAVVLAFRKSLGLADKEIIIPSLHTVLGALGCAVLAAQNAALPNLSLASLRATTEKNRNKIKTGHFLPALRHDLEDRGPDPEPPRDSPPQRPFVMGLDLGSVSVKGVIIDAQTRIIREHYLLSQSQTLQAAQTVIQELTSGDLFPDAVAVTGSGRYLIGKLLDADLIVNEITAQAAAAMNFEPNTDIVVEIGGQDSKWIAFENGHIKDFEMNRVCAAGTGSFLMAQAERLGLEMGREFSTAAFASLRPADLGSRCTVFMESDLIHHQNNGASTGDLAAGVCVSVVQNYLERVANNKSLGKRVLFLGGVAVNPAVTAAFEQCTGREFRVPPFYRVSGAFGAALKALESMKSQVNSRGSRASLRLDTSHIGQEQFGCKRCPNQCRINKYSLDGRTVFHGGLCDRWENEQGRSAHHNESEPFSLRTELLENLTESPDSARETWHMVRSPQFYEWFPFWKTFCEHLGINLKPASRNSRKLFEAGSPFLPVETCLPMKAIAGQIKDLVDCGVKTLFHPTILIERFERNEQRPVDYCPFIQASSQFFKGAFDLDWKELLVQAEIDPDSFRREHVKFARSLGFSLQDATAALESAMARQAAFGVELQTEGRRFLDSLEDDEKAIVVLGKPYHLSDPFLNMNLGTLLQGQGIKAIPGDIFPIDPAGTKPRRVVSWKYQWQLVRTASELASDPRLFPVLITFFGCGPDSFTLRHVNEALRGKPLLVLEMDEHSSRAGILTRIEAFLDRVLSLDGRSKNRARSRKADEPETSSARRSRQRRPAEVIYMPNLCEHSYGFAAAARSVGIEAEVLSPPDMESERLGRPYVVGGECHPYVLVLGDYLKIATSLPPQRASRSRFYMLGMDACRLGQFPVYLERVRRQLGLGMGVIESLPDTMKSFNISEKDRQRALLRVWEGLNAYDVLLGALLQIRPRARDPEIFSKLYPEARDHLYVGLCEGRIKQGMEEALHILQQAPTREIGPRPVVAVTGDYYTRVVPFANNNVYRQVESLGGVLWSPPTFSDSFKMGVMRNMIWGLLNHRSREAARNGLFYAVISLLEFRIKSARAVRRFIPTTMDITGIDLWRKVAPHANTKLPSGITAPISTALKYVDFGAAGVLNLMTLNCSYGTVVTAALLRALKQRNRVPMLTLIYDGLQKTNEKTRLEAFMSQVWDHFDASCSTKRNTI
ncbi:MAG: hypothetical protein HY912_04180 [Desulfomonile tiedjei]|uniref:CoA-substrate-specific enzyme activase n=1 Tax=Desulfomonile tiedjei TaxID=2358 RepID=A0A9D6Z2E6_9BACT|nr:hypothetical protein [Desulfomonile tiedjei]